LDESEKRRLGIVLVTAALNSRHLSSISKHRSAVWKAAKQLIIQRHNPLSQFLQWLFAELCTKEREQMVPKSKYYIAEPDVRQYGP
jgi:hypothetical protein